MDIKFIKKILSKFDFFGVKYSFYYKNKQKYYSATGGIAFIIFFIISLIYIIININSLFKRTSISIIYYDTPISVTDDFSFENYSTALSFGITCGNYDEKVNPSLHNDLFYLEFKYTKLSKEKGQKIKIKKDIPIKLCKHSDFFNEYNTSFDSLGLSALYCPDFSNESIHGMYSDENFSYYEIGIRAKSIKDTSYYINLFTNYDCKLMLYYLNVGTNIYDFKNPITKAIDVQFIQLSPVEYNKLNIYFQLIKFDSDESFFFEPYKTKYYVDYSRNEIYNVYKGDDRLEIKGRDYDHFATMYLRADTQRKLVSRRYLKFHEFIANTYGIINAFQFLISLFIVQLNLFYSHQSVIKKIFYIKDINNQNQKTNYLENHKKKYFKNKIDKSIISEKINIYNSSKIISKSINNLNLKNNYINLSNRKLLSKNHEKHNQTNLYDSNLSNKKLIKTNKNSNKNNLIDSFKKQNENTITLKASYFIKNQIENIKINKNKKDTNFYFNIFEIIIILFCPIICSKKLEKKNKLLNIAKKKFIFNFDIITFFKNMQLIELMNFILLDKYQFIMFKFLSKPFISLKNQFDLFDNIIKSYKEDFTDQDIKEFKNGYKFLLDKIDKNHQEKKIFKLITKEINNIIDKKI